MESNIVSIDGLIGSYRRHERLRDYLIKNIANPQIGTNGSIRKYENFKVGEIPFFVYKKSAYEMLINSGAMKLMTNRSLLLDITECYSTLEILQQDFTTYYNFKMNEFQKLNDLKEPTSYNKSILSPEYRSMFNFYVNMQKGQYPIEVKQHIKKDISELRQ